MEADLAFRGIDFRDFWLSGGGASRLSLRRLTVLLRSLPADSMTRSELLASMKTSKSDALKARRDHYAAKKATQEKEAARD